MKAKNEPVDLATTSGNLDGNSFLRLVGADSRKVKLNTRNMVNSFELCYKGFE